MQRNVARLLIIAFFLGFCSPCIWGRTAVELSSVRLYLPDSELHRRLGDDATPLADYIKVLVSTTTEFWKKSAEPEAKGLLIAVGIKPGKRSRIWCDAVNGKIPPGTLAELEKVLSEVPAIDVREGPMAFAIEIRLGTRAVKEFPMFPAAWSEAIKKSGDQFTIPDGLFKIIWPD